MISLGCANSSLCLLVDAVLVLPVYHINTLLQGCTVPVRMVQMAQMILLTLCDLQTRSLFAAHDVQVDHEECLHFIAVLLSNASAQVRDNSKDVLLDWYS